MMNLKEICLWSFLFCLLYFEPINIAGIKISHAWKVIIVYLLLCGILFRLSTNSKGYLVCRKSPNFLLPGYLFAFWPIIGSFPHENILPSVVATGTRLFPIMTMHWVYLKGYSRNFMLSMSDKVALFIVISSLPFLFNILEPLGKTYDLSGLSYVSGSTFVGFFQKPHSASLTISLALLVVLVRIIEYNYASKKEYFLKALIALALAILLLLTYVRSGVAAVSAGLFLYLILVRKFKILCRYAIIASIVCGLFMVIVPDIDSFRVRMLGKTLRTIDNNTDINSLSSGRITIWSRTIEIIQNTDPLVLLTGYGQGGFFDEMISNFGKKNVAHNGFLDELVMYGLIGFSLLIKFFHSLFKDILSIQDSRARRTGLVALFGLITFGFFQGFDVPLQLLMLSPFFLFNYLPDFE